MKLYNPSFVKAYIEAELLIVEQELRIAEADSVTSLDRRRYLLRRQEALLAASVQAVKQQAEETEKTALRVWPQEK